MHSQTILSVDPTTGNVCALATGQALGGSLIGPVPNDKTRIAVLSAKDARRWNTLGELPHKPDVQKRIGELLRIQPASNE